MADNRKSNSQYFLSRAQVIVLTVAFTITCVAAFVLGMVIGQGIEERKVLQREEPLVKLALPPGTAGSKGGPGAAAKDDLTFYDTLGQPSPAAPPVKEAKAAEKTAKTAKETKAARETRLAARETKSATKEAKPAVKEIKPAAAEAPPAAETAPEGGAAEKASSTAEAKKPEPLPRESGWTVQVNAYPEEKTAQRLVERLKEKGYDAYMVVSNVKGRTWYRVRVGKFSTREEAKKQQEELQTNENLTKTVTVSR